MGNYRYFQTLTWSWPGCHTVRDMSKEAENLLCVPNTASDLHLDLYLSLIPQLMGICMVNLLESSIV